MTGDFWQYPLANDASLLTNLWPMTGGYIGKSMAKQMPYLHTSATFLENVTALQVIAFTVLTEQ
jgi:hypothetical protein